VSPTAAASDGALRRFVWEVGTRLVLFGIVAGTFVEVETPAPSYDRSLRLAAFSFLPVALLTPPVVSLGVRGREDAGEI
jgi:hypothetical protein